MKKITRRNFLIASGKTVGTLAAASAFMGCASPEQAENCFPRSAMPVRTDDRLTAIDDIVENYMGQGYFPGATIVVLLCFMFAMMFLLIGIIGEYIAILFTELKDRPVYIVEKTENL